MFVDFLIKLAGYVLVTSGIFMLYLLYFRKDRMPPIFSKVWFIIVMTFVSAVLAVIGWILVAGL